MGRVILRNTIDGDGIDWGRGEKGIERDLVREWGSHGLWDLFSFFIGSWVLMGMDGLFVFLMGLWPMIFFH